MLCRDRHIRHATPFPSPSPHTNTHKHMHSHARINLQRCRPSCPAAGERPGTARRFVCLHPPVSRNSQSHDGAHLGSGLSRGKGDLDPQAGGKKGNKPRIVPCECPRLGGPPSKSFDVAAIAAMRVCAGARAAALACAASSSGKWSSGHPKKRAMWWHGFGSIELTCPSLSPLACAILACAKRAEVNGTWVPKS